MISYGDTVINAASGLPVSGATVAVTTVSGTPVQLYSDNSGTPIGSPINQVATDSLGYFRFYIYAGIYTLTISYNGMVQRTLVGIPIGLDGASAFQLKWEDFGVVPGAIADAVGNSAAWAAMIASGAYKGRTLVAAPATTYRFSKRLPLVAGMSVTGAKGGLAPRLIFGADYFNSTNNSWQGPTSASDATTGVSIWGTTDPNSPIVSVHFEGFKLDGLSQDGRFIRALSIFNARQISISDVEIANMPAAIGLHMGSVSYSTFERLYIHDFYSNGNSFTKTPPNISAIEVDNDRVSDSSGNSVWSRYNTFSIGTLENMVCGPAYVAAYGDQSDGLNDQGSKFSSYSDYTIRNCNELVDTWSVGGVYTNFALLSDRYSGLKVLHGAKNNVFDGFVIGASTHRAVYLGGDNTTSSPTSGGGHTKHNSFANFVIDQPALFAITLEDTPSSFAYGVQENAFSNITVNCSSTTAKIVADSLPLTNSKANVFQGVRTNDANLATALDNVFQTLGASVFNVAGTGVWTNGNVSVAQTPPLGTSTRLIQLTGDQTLSVALNGVRAACGSMTITIPSGIDFDRAQFVLTDTGTNAAITVVAGSGVVLYVSAGKQAKTSGLQAALTIEKFAADRYRIGGDLAAA
jgi:hypothetical protein